MNTKQAATKIIEILRQLPTPRHAAAAIAIARANIHFQAGGDTETNIRKMIEEDDKAVLEIWSAIAEQHLSN